MEKKFRSSCIIASALDLIGDKWSLLIVRDMLMHKKKTFKEFAASEENVATNLLSSRLKLLESINVISKNKLANNKKENIYLLTEKGIDLAPLILEIVLWSDKYVRGYNVEMNEYETEIEELINAINTESFKQTKARHEARDKNITETHFQTKPDTFKQSLYKHNKYNEEMLKTHFKNTQTKQNQQQTNDNKHTHISKNRLLSMRTKLTQYKPKQK